MTELNNTVLKAIVTTLQSKVDYLEAENKALERRFFLPAGQELVKVKGLLQIVQDARAELGGQVVELKAKNKSANEVSISLKHSNDHLFKERDQLIERNTQLLKDNTKLVTKVRKIESGNFDEFFTYATEPVQLAAYGTAVVNIAITREADFYLTKLARVATSPFSFLIRDSSNDRQWSNIPLHSDLGAGTVQLPLILPKPRFVARASNITIEVTNLTGCANEVRLALIGYKVYHVENLYYATGKEKKEKKASSHVWDGL